MGGVSVTDGWIEAIPTFEYALKALENADARSNRVINDDIGALGYRGIWRKVFDLLIRTSTRPSQTLFPKAAGGFGGVGTWREITE